MAASVSKDVLDRETDARFYAQSGRPPGQKLDPNNPADKAYIPVWKDTFHKVKAEAAAGKLVTTYDHPAVAQPLADAEVAHKAAAGHAEAAAAATDPATIAQHIAAGATAAQVSALKAGEAAAKQPPTVSPKLLHQAGKEAIKTPPHPSAPAVDHLAHAVAHHHARGHHMHHPLVPAPGHPHMAQVSPHHVPPTVMPHPHMPHMPPSSWGSYARSYPAAYAARPYPYPPQPYPQYAAQPPGPGHHHRHHHQHPHHPQMPQSPGGSFDSGGGSFGGAPSDPGPSAVTPEDVAPPDDSPMEGGGPPPMDAQTPPAGPTPDSFAAPSEEPSHLGRNIAIGVAILAGGGLLYYAASGKPSRKPSSSWSSRTPRPPGAPGPAAGVPALPRGARI